MEHLLKELKEQKKIGCLYLANGCDEKECMGYVTEVRDDYFLVAKIDDDGIADGYVIGLISDIYSVETKHKFLQRLEVLYQLKKQSHLPLHVQSGENLMYDVIDLCEKDKLVAYLYVQDSDINYPLVGFVKRKEKLLELTALDAYGEVSSTLYFKIEDIVCMTIESVYEQSRHILHDYYQNQ